jgi:hypothetical protein
MWDSGRALPLLLMSVERGCDVVIVAEPEGGYSVLVPELPSVATQGETIEEAHANARESGGLRWPRRGGLKWPLLASVGVCC